MSVRPVLSLSVLGRVGLGEVIRSWGMRKLVLRKAAPADVVVHTVIPALETDLGGLLEHRSLDHLAI
jgi:hypothetical protein